MFWFNLQAVLIFVAVGSVPSALLALQIAWVFGISLSFIPAILFIGLVSLIVASLIEGI
jgi:hypothetical protein